MRGIHRSPVDSPHKGTVTGKTISFDDVIMGRTTHDICCGSLSIPLRPQHRNRPWRSCSLLHTHTRSHRPCHSCRTRKLNSFNSLRQRHIGRHTDDIFKCIFVNEKSFILIRISLKFVLFIRVQLTIIQYRFR